MSRIYRLFCTSCLAATFIFSVTNVGCAGRVRVYDDYHADWHHWDQGEDSAYRQYWSERREPYRNYSKLNKDEQKDYWNWRHNHTDSDRH